jgi:hypothetical protein
VHPDDVSSVFVDMIPKDRKAQHYRLVENFFHFTPVFETLRSAKIIDEAVMHELIKLLRFQQVSKAGTAIYKYGSIVAYGNTSIEPTDMEAFFVVKGRVSLKAPRLKEGVSEKFMIENYEDIIWEKMRQGADVRKSIDSIIVEGREPSEYILHDAWVFD